MTEPAAAEPTVWVVDLDDPRAATQSRIEATLDESERVRAARFVSLEHSRRWQRSRFALRCVLGEATGVSPPAVRLKVAAGGKPSLAGGGPSFSLAHSAAVALIAVGGRGEVGVDVERVRSGLREEEILGRVVGAAAVEAWRACDPELRTATFFRQWVRREAALKCRGLGIGASIGHDVAAGLVLRDLSLDHHYAGAWASDDLTSSDLSVKRFNWRSSAN